MNKLIELAKLGQSVWYDYIRRSFIINGELQSLIDIGLRGITSNPSIFEKAIAESTDYDEDIKLLMHENLTVESIYEKLSLMDITLAADLFEPVYKATNKLDGYVSIEVSPELAYNTDATIAEGKRLFKAINRPNIMIKVPATEQGLPAITELIASWVNVNITLLFSVKLYHKVTDAYFKGLELLADKGGNLNSVSSVASFFVSRIDTSADKALDNIANTELKGKIAVANARNAYKLFKEKYNSERWFNLEKRNARKQRLLWASTSTKNPAYPTTMYVDELIGNETVNTIPPATLKIYLEHGALKPTIEESLQESLMYLSKLEKLNISLDTITDNLQKEGVKSFSDAYKTLLKSLEGKVNKLRIEEKQFNYHLGMYRDDYEKALSKLESEKIIQRIWNKDYTVWSDKPDEISNRLGWLKSPADSIDAISSLNEFAKSIIADGYTHALLLGMGGSSLAPEVFSMTFGNEQMQQTQAGIDLKVLDSTDPGAVLKYTAALDPLKTLYIVSTKSGGTVETFSFMKHFYNHTASKTGKENAGKHFVAITDPGSGLEKAAKELKFRNIFLNDPDIGGRYSALSLFGIVPAALIGIDLMELLKRASIMVCRSAVLNDMLEYDNSPARLGLIIGCLAKTGRDKLTFILPDKLSHFGDWVEQLIAESTGKTGKGILPVVGEAVLSPADYANDRLFVYIKLANDNALNDKVNALEQAGHPVIEITINDIYDLGAEFFRWEMATAVIGYSLGINPFDQPDVEAAKILARKMIDDYKAKGKLSLENPAFNEKDIKVYGEIKGASLKEIFNNFLNRFNKGESRSYICLQAYLKPDDKTTEALQSLRNKLQKKFKAASTVGYGPRFLHSTGQLHKGDAGNGLFIQFTANMTEDVPIPDNPLDNKSSMTFGVLKTAQALGDRQAMLNKKRNVISFNLGNDIVKALKMLEDTLS